MYKDKDKQREAQRNWVRQKRAEKGSTSQGSTPQGSTHNDDAYNYSRNPVTLVKPERTAQGNIRVSKPGDDDYPQCETTRAKSASVIPCDTRLEVIPVGTPIVIPCEVEPVKPKRGKDIKCFEDLPPNVQATIRRVGDTNEEFQRRVGIAIRYQHAFPGYRGYVLAGIEVGKELRL